MLGGVLTLASQFRIVANMPIVWFTDNEALTSFLDKDPPLNKRLRRWYLYLSQFQMKIFHLPGLKNELCDYLSRHAFDTKIDESFEELVKETFVKMDCQLDLCMQQILVLSDKFAISAQDYLGTEYEEIWTQNHKNKTFFHENAMYYKTDQKLFCERKLVIPPRKIHEVLKICHESNNHPGSERTMLFFLKNFWCSLTKTELLLKAKAISDSCQVCILAKPNSARDRGELSSLPIPQLCNDIVYLDFVQMDPYNNFDYVLTVVDALSHFVQFLPCHKGITGEGVLKLLLERWIAPYGKPSALHSDNDVRFKSQKGYYQSIFRALDIETHFSIPRQPRTNGLCENENRAFLQNMRALSLSLKTNDWPKLVGYCTWVMNTQISPTTSLSPHEMFLGRPAWKFELVPEPISTPEIQSWLLEQVKMQEKASLQLAKLRATKLKRVNQRRLENPYKVGDFVLIHNKRWPQRRFPKLCSPWQGPFKILKVRLTRSYGKPVYGWYY